MDSLTISVSDEAMSAEIDGWQDGAEYTLRVRQDSPGQFTALAAKEAVDGEAETEEDETPHEMPRGPGGKMPAVAIVISKGRGK